MQLQVGYLVQAKAFTKNASLEYFDIILVLAVHAVVEQVRKGRSVMRIVRLGVDAGHGGKDSGAAQNSLMEKTIALNICLGIKTQVEREYEGIEVFLTRSTDVFLELEERTDMMNKLGVDALVSVHCNAGGGMGGFESYRYTKASANAVKLQDSIHKELMVQLSPFGVRDRGQKTKNLHMVRESKMPAALTENLFIDVLADSERLKRPDIIQAIVDGHVMGIGKYFELKKKEGKENMDTVNVIAYGKKIKEGFLMDGTVYVPLRALAEASGDIVTWDNTTKTATVTKKD